MAWQCGDEAAWRRGDDAAWREAARRQSDVRVARPLRIRSLTTLCGATYALRHLSPKWLSRLLTGDMKCLCPCVVRGCVWACMRPTTAMATRSATDEGGELTGGVGSRAHFGGLAGVRAAVNCQMPNPKSPRPAGLPSSPALPQPLFEELAYTAFPHASEISSSPSIDAHHLNVSRVVGCLF